MRGQLQAFGSGWLSALRDTFASMFEMGRLPHPEELGLLDGAELINVLAAAASIERLARAYRMHLTDRLHERRAKVPTRPPRAATSSSRSSRRRRRRKARKRRLRRH